MAKAMSHLRKGLQLNDPGSLTELVHQREQRSGGKAAEFHIGKSEETRFHTVSDQWACFKAG